MAQPRGSARLLALLAALSTALPPAGTITVSMKTKPVIASLNDNTSIACQIHGYDTPVLDISAMGVTWSRKTSNTDKEETLLQFLAGKSTSYRLGTSISMGELIRGNASLFLPKVQFKEAGTYKCKVTVTPSAAEDTGVLEVVAQPAVNLFPEEVTTESDKEKTLSCEVKNFYPSSLNIRWVKVSKNHQDGGVTGEDICTGTSVENEDGTFNVISKLRLQPSLQDSGNVYRCIVSHKSLQNNLLLNATLTVTAPKSDLGTLAGTCVGTILVCIFIIAVVLFIYKKYFKKIPPNVIAFTGNVEMKHLENSVLYCQISGFRPKRIMLDFFLKKHQQEKEKIYSWTSIQQDTKQSSEGTALLQKFRDFQFQFNLQSHDNGTFEVSWTIYVCPNVQEHDQAELSLEIGHEALQRGPIIKTTLLKVRAEPDLDPVLCSTDELKLHERLTLTCRIHSFFPKTIELQWYKDEQALEESVTSEGTKRSDGLFFCTTNLTIVPKAEDVGKRFTCKAKHRNSHLYKESSWQLENLVLNPQVSEIECDPTIPEVGNSVTLSCKITNYYPAECQVRWIRDFEELGNAAFKMEDIQQNTAPNLHHKASRITIMPQPEDHAVTYYIEVTHFSRTIRKAYPLMLKGFPKVTGPVSHPNDVKYGEPLSITCEVMDFYPKDIQVQWLKEEDEIRSDSFMEDLKQDSKGCFHTSCKLDLTPTALDYGKKIVFRVKHETLTQSITKCTFLNLPARSPTVSEIRATPAQPNIDETVCLETCISDFAPKDIKVTWYKDWTKLQEDNALNPQIARNGLCFYVSKLRFSPKASDNKTSLICEVTHLATHRCIEKYFELKLRGFSTSTGDLSTLTTNQNHKGSLTNPRSSSLERAPTLKIQCLTNNPKAGENVTLQCFIYGINTDNTYVSWYKGRYPIEGGIENTDYEDKPGFTSSVNFKTKEDEKECKIRCEVVTEDETFEEAYTLKLG
ncbi:PREDICTED: natural cytotoxicity triggering receptor 3 ligand 1 isoform X1 [Gavialis gangeticus]|uniref:natural cytotoxicity triggering receptor 3 ligand 1 isoform X1 n=2 Tax=Gavialis gangeticus TaxID=94835 RepID=UPI00092FB47C|nr:PREDICTED: natural cytotoxicity triggering receptor 3 ligand 1 isoform X1 [Gavialis gangeticus]